MLMKRTVLYSLALTFLSVGIAGVSGCVDRRFVISTDPPGAIVFDEKNQPIGASPADKQFTYYGKYRFTLVHDGFETMVVEEKVNPPWYEIIGLDFFSENLLPVRLRDVRRFHYVMQPAQMVPPEAVRNQAEQLRAKGKAIGTPLPPKFPEEAPLPRTVPAPAPGVPPAPPAVVPTLPQPLIAPEPLANPNPQLGAPLPR
jgi:hypothetical protein